MMSKFNDIFFNTYSYHKIISLRYFVIVCLVLLFTNSAYAVDEEFLEYCVGDYFESKYASASCWSCDIIKVLMNSMMNLAKTLFDVIKEISVLVLQLGGAIWLAMYFMKSLSSLAAQDPAKVLDGAIMFMFKWALVYAVIFAGLDTIMEYIVNPLLSIGFDVGMELAGASSISGI